MIRLSVILFTLGCGVGLITCAMLILFVYSLLSDTPELAANFGFGMIVSFLITIGLILSGGDHVRATRVRERELFLAMLLFWFFLPGIAAMPLTAATDIANIAQAYWEASAALTTTGASLFSSPETTPRPFILWRAILSWIGGFWTLTFAIAILAPNVIGGLITSISLPTSPLHQHDERAPILQRLLRIQRLLLPLYLIPTIIGVGIIWVGGASAFDAICLGLSAISTSGHAPTSAPLVQAYSAASLIGITILSLFGAINLPLIFGLMRRGGPAFFIHGREWRYFVLFCIGFTLISLGLFGGVVLEVVMQVISLFTTAAFQFMPLRDVESWPIIWILLPCMIGGMSLSTAGGIKIQRVLMLMRDTANELARLTHPSSLQVFRYDEIRVSRQNRNALWSYLAAFLFFIALGLVLAGGFGVGFEDAWSITITMLSNSGNALVLTQSDFAALSPLMYIWMAFLMVAGRVELLILVALFTPSFWRFAREPRRGF